MILLRRQSQAAAGLGTQARQRHASHSSDTAEQGKLFCRPYQDYIWECVALLHICLQLVIHKVGSREVIAQGCVPGIEQVP